jgi:hypothetical protein
MQDLAINRKLSLPEEWYESIGKNLKEYFQRLQKTLKWLAIAFAAVFILAIFSAVLKVINVIPGAQLALELGGIYLFTSKLLLKSDRSITLKQVDVFLEELIG